MTAKTSVQAVMNASTEWSNVKSSEANHLSLILAKHKETGINCRFIFGKEQILLQDELVTTFLAQRKVCMFEQN